MEFFALLLVVLERKEGQQYVGRTYNTLMPILPYDATYARRA